MTDVFHKPAAVRVAQIEYRRLDDGRVEFLSITVGGEPIPLRNVSPASLLQAYAKHRRITLG